MQNKTTSNGVKPNLNEEKKLWKKGYKRIVGLDESGRGPLAAPVVAAAVMVKSPIANRQTPKPNPGFQICARTVLAHFGEVKDSKQLSSKKREELYKILINHPAIGWGIGRVSEKVIDKINIKNAAELAMLRAVQKLKPGPDFLIIDGIHLANHKLKVINHKLIIKADQKVFSCACASILAKVWRDRIMQRYHKKYPQYGFNKHKGYPTKYHLKMLKRYGPSVIHRKSFGPVKKMV